VSTEAERLAVGVQPGFGHVPVDAAPNPISAGAGVGPVHIGVTDGGRAAVFYRDVLGLTPMPDGGDGLLRFGAGGVELVVIHPGAERGVERGRTGLYHLAILVPNRRELARVIARLMSLRYPNSPTDHTLTKSDYLWDPDGNGIEVYCETPEDGTWVFSGGQFGAIDNDGNVRSGRDPIDLDVMFQELREDDRLEEAMPAGTKMGHVHLHIRDVAEAVLFYRDLIGFDVQGLAPDWGVAFVSAGGYHHHLGLNTWAGEGVPPGSPEAAGLRHYTIEVPGVDDLESVRQRLLGAGVEVTDDADGGFLVDDPSRNRVLVRVRPA
jgi:catechol 2,3-dioxygenase